MDIIPCKDYDEMSRLGADSVMKVARKHPAMLLCTATGYSPEGVYRRLAGYAGHDPGLFSAARVIKLDEWLGLRPEESASCESYLREKVIGPLHIPPQNYISFKGDAADPVEECRKVEAALGDSGPIDVSILGLGINGHLGFIEPAETLKPFSHIARLSGTSQMHAMIQDRGDIPAMGLTLGLSALLQSKKVVLLISGPGKKPVRDRLMTGEITTWLPASFLWLHPLVECFLDESSA